MKDEDERFCKSLITIQSIIPCKKQGETIKGRTLKNGSKVALSKSVMVNNCPHAFPTCCPSKYSPWALMHFIHLLQRSTFQTWN